MPFTLDNVVPWGRSFDEYVAMFALSDADLDKTILGCGDGPANFNREMTRTRIRETRRAVIDQTRKNRHEFVWEHVRSVEELERLRLHAMDEFLEDYPSGLAEGRYVAGALPRLPFADRRFDLALCSHLLFLYSARLSAEFHLRSIRELCRVAREARIFPLLELGATKSRHLDAVASRLREEGYEVTIDRVPYEFQRGGDEQMRVTAK